MQNSYYTVLNTLYYAPQQWWFLDSELIELVLSTNFKV